jgi:hypothetical protein
MSAALTSPARPTPLARFWRRVWLAYRVTQAEKDYRALAEQMQRDLLQLEVYSKQIAIWRAEIAYHQEPTKEGS